MRFTVRLALSSHAQILRCSLADYFKELKCALHRYNDYFSSFVIIAAAVVVLQTPRKTSSGNKHLWSYDYFAIIPCFYNVGGVHYNLTARSAVQANTEN